MAAGAACPAAGQPDPNASIHDLQDSGLRSGQERRERCSIRTISRRWPLTERDEELHFIQAATNRASSGRATGPPPTWATPSARSFRQIPIGGVEGTLGTR